MLIKQQRIICVLLFIYFDRYSADDEEIQPDSADQNQNKSHALEVARTPTFDFEREFQSLLHKKIPAISVRWLLNCFDAYFVLMDDAAFYPQRYYFPPEVPLPRASTNKAFSSITVHPKFLSLSQRHFWIMECLEMKGVVHIRQFLTKLFHFLSELIDKNNFSETNEDLKRFFPALKGEIPRLYHMQELMISRVLAEKIITREHRSALTVAIEERIERQQNQLTKEMSSIGSALPLDQPLDENRLRIIRRQFDSYRTQTIEYAIPDLDYILSTVEVDEADSLNWPIDLQTLFLIPSDANSAWSLKTEALINWLTAKNFRFVEIFVPPIDEAIFVAQKIHDARKRMNGRQQRIPNINIEPGLSFEDFGPEKISCNPMNMFFHGSKRIYTQYVKEINTKYSQKGVKEKIFNSEYRPTTYKSDQPNVEQKDLKGRKKPRHGSAVSPEKNLLEIEVDRKLKEEQQILNTLTILLNRHHHRQNVLAFVLPSEVIKIVRKILIVNKTIHGSSIAGTVVCKVVRSHEIVSKKASQRSDGSSESQSLNSQARDNSHGVQQEANNDGRIAKEDAHLGRIDESDHEEEIQQQSEENAPPESGNGTSTSSSSSSLAPPQGPSFSSGTSSRQSSISVTQFSFDLDVTGVFQ